MPDEDVDDPEVVDDSSVDESEGSPTETTSVKPTVQQNKPTTVSDVQVLRSELGKVRKEAQGWRQKLRIAETERDSHAGKAAQFDSIMSELGIEDISSFDPKKFAEEYKDVVVSHQHNRRKFAVHKAATAAGTDPDILLDLNSFMSKVSELDPDDKKFDDKITEAVKTAMESNPVLSNMKKTSDRPSVASPELAGNKPPEGQVTEAELSSMSSAEIVKARKEGRLRNILGA